MPDNVFAPLMVNLCNSDTLVFIFSRAKVLGICAFSIAAAACCVCHVVNNRFSRQLI